MTNSHSGPATSPAGPSGRVRCEWCNLLDHTPSECPYLAQRDPVGQALFLVELLTELATARLAAVVKHANAYLDATGTDASRSQTARIAAANERLAAEFAAAKVAGYQHILKGTVLEGTSDD
jgi:hypothetical protein